jgi:hypothetical protein
MLKKPAAQNGFHADRHRPNEGAAPISNERYTARLAEGEVPVPIEGSMRKPKEGPGNRGTETGSGTGQSREGRGGGKVTFGK